nr:unnamed protein product [Spirometra erinaceieuropaei]
MPRTRVIALQLCRCVTSGPQSTVKGNFAAAQKPNLPKKPGNTYMTPEYYMHNKYTFFDFIGQMRPKRQPQPNPR